VRLARIFYLVVIPLTIGLMLLHHGGDWIRKLVALRFRGPAGAGLHIGSGGEMRMHRAERIQHGLLLISFFVLVWTGFALRYPDAFWAKPLVVWESRWPLRGWIHRAAGAVLIGVSILHVVTLAVNRKLRQHWLSLIPRRWDAGQAVGMLLYNLGLRQKKPAVSPHSYVEKVEYWAVVWGTALMALTGIALWSTNFMLAYFPKVWLDFAGTVHFYEAVLATLAIVVWHFYTVIFDPEVYPMDTAWLTGKSPRLRERLEAGQQTDDE
jgi:cytochrome b subunit of formate dehydrogenase